MLMDVRRVTPGSPPPDLLASYPSVNPTDGLFVHHVPTVLRHAGSYVRILLPPREHGPAHVHIRRAGGVVTIELPEGSRPSRVRNVSGMREADVIAAVRLVEAHAEFLRAQWRLYHG